MDYEIRVKDSFHVSGIAKRTSNDKAVKDIPQLWQTFSSEKIYQEIPHKTTENIIALYTDYEGDHRKPYTLLLGGETSLPSHTSYTIPSATYAVFTVRGDFPHQLFLTWGYIWQSTLKRTYAFDFELYPPTFWSSDDPTMEVWVGIS